MQQNSVTSAIMCLVTADLERNCCKTFAKGYEVLSYCVLGGGGGKKRDVW